MEEHYNELQAEIAELEDLLRQAEQRQNDPEAETAAGMFRQLLSRRERKLASLSSP